MKVIMILVMLLSACGQIETPEYTPGVEDRIYAKDIITASPEWIDDLDRVMTQLQTDIGDCQLPKISRTRGREVMFIPPEEWPFNPAYSGLWDGTIWISVSADGWFPDVVLLHELGHSFGLPHSPERNSVMAEPIRNSTLTSEDIQNFRRALGCN